MLGHNTTVCDAPWPTFNEEYLKEDKAKMMVAFNGKARFPMEFPVDTDQQTIIDAVLQEPQSQKWIQGFSVVKVIVVPNKMINIVLKPA